MITWVQPGMAEFFILLVDSRGYDRDLIGRKAETFTPTPGDIRADDWEILVWNGRHCGVYSDLEELRGKEG